MDPRATATLVAPQQPLCHNRGLEAGVIVAGKRYLALILWGSMCLTGCQPLERAAVPPFRALRPSPTQRATASMITAIPAPTLTPTPEPTPLQATPDPLATPTQDAAALT